MSADRSFSKNHIPTGLSPFANAHRPHAATRRCGRLLSTPGGRLPYGANDSFAVNLRSIKIGARKN